MCCLNMLQMFVFEIKLFDLNEWIQNESLVVCWVVKSQNISIELNWFKLFFLLTKYFILDIKNKEKKLSLNQLYHFLYFIKNFNYVRDTKEIKLFLSEI